MLCYNVSIINRGQQNVNKRFWVVLSTTDVDVRLQNNIAQVQINSKNLVH